MSCCLDCLVFNEPGHSLKPWNPPPRALRACCGLQGTTEPSTSPKALSDTPDSALVCKWISQGVACASLATGNGAPTFFEDLLRKSQAETVLPGGLTTGCTKLPFSLFGVQWAPPTPLCLPLLSRMHCSSLLNKNKITFDLGNDEDG